MAQEKQAPVRYNQFQFFYQPGLDLALGELTEDACLEVHENYVVVIFDKKDIENSGRTCIPLAGLRFFNFSQPI